VTEPDEDETGRREDVLDRRGQAGGGDALACPAAGQGAPGAAGPAVTVARAAVAAIVAGTPGGTRSGEELEEGRHKRSSVGSGDDGPGLGARGGEEGDPVTGTSRNGGGAPRQAGNSRGKAVRAGVVAYGGDRRGGLGSPDAQRGALPDVAGGINGEGGLAAGCHSHDGPPRQRSAGARQGLIGPSSVAELPAVACAPRHEPPELVARRRVVVPACHCPGGPPAREPRGGETGRGGLRVVFGVPRPAPGHGARRRCVGASPAHPHASSIAPSSQLTACPRPPGPDPAKGVEGCGVAPAARHLCHCRGPQAFNEERAGGCARRRAGTCRRVGGGAVVGACRCK